MDRFVAGSAAIIGYVLWCAWCLFHLLVSFSSPRPAVAVRSPHHDRSLHESPRSPLPSPTPSTTTHPVLCINPAITYGLFERTKTALSSSSKPGVVLGSWTIFLLGLLSKTIATVVTYPYIMAKVRLQWKPADYKTNDKVRYTGAIDVLRRIYQRDGFTGLYKVASSHARGGMSTDGSLVFLSPILSLSHALTLPGRPGSPLQGMQAQISKAVLSQALLFVLKDKLTLYTYVLFVFLKWGGKSGTSSNHRHAVAAATTKS